MKQKYGFHEHMPLYLGEQLVYKSFGQILELFDSSVAQERPPAADVFASAHIDFNHQVFFFEIAGLSEKFTLRTGYKAVSPELNAIGLAGRIRFKTNPVD